MAISCNQEAGSSIEGIIDRIAITEQLVTENSIPVDAVAAFNLIKGVEDCGVKKREGPGDALPRITGKSM